MDWVNSGRTGAGMDGGRTGAGGGRTGAGAEFGADGGARCK